MKKLILVSMLYQSAERIRKLVPDLKGKTVTYIPTAGLAEEAEGMVEAEAKILESIGLTVEVLEVSSVSPVRTADRLTQNDIIYVGGGNTFFLLQELRRSGADQIITREVNRGKLYIGESAGAVIACPDIGYCAGMDSSEKAPELADYTGLGLVDFYIVPHIGNAEMGEAARKAVEEYSSSIELKAITDEQLIYVENEQIEIL